MSKIFEIPHRNDYLLGRKMVNVHRHETYEEWQEEIDPSENIPLEPPIERTTKLLTKTIECKVDILNIDMTTRVYCILHIGNIEILSETRTCQANSTAEFETYTYTKDFKCYLRHHQTVELRIGIGFEHSEKIAEGRRFEFVLVESPKNIQFKSFLSNDFNPYEKYYKLLVEFDYKCLDVKYIEV